MATIKQQGSADTFMSERGFSVESVDIFDLKVHPEDARIPTVVAWLFLAIAVAAVAVVIWVI